MTGDINLAIQQIADNLGVSVDQIINFIPIYAAAKVDWNFIMSVFSTIMAVVVLLVILVSSIILFRAKKKSEEESSYDPWKSWYWSDHATFYIIIFGSVFFFIALAVCVVEWTGTYMWINHQDAMFVDDVFKMLKVHS